MTNTETQEECSLCGGSGYEKVHAGVIECEACDGTGTLHYRTIELTERQRGAPGQDQSVVRDDHLPEPTDEQAMKSLLDTWDAVGEGLYSEDES